MNFLNRIRCANKQMPMSKKILKTIAVLFNMTFSYGWIYFGIYSSLELIVFICGLVILRRSTIKETIVTTAIGVIAAMILNMILPFYWG